MAPRKRTGKNSTASGYAPRRIFTIPPPPATPIGRKRHRYTPGTVAMRDVGIKSSYQTKMCEHMNLSSKVNTYAEKTKIKSICNQIIVYKDKLKEIASYIKITKDERFNSYSYDLELCLDLIEEPENSCASISLSDLVQKACKIVTIYDNLPNKINIKFEESPPPKPVDVKIEMPLIPRPITNIIQERSLLNQPQPQPQQQQQIRHQYNRSYNQNYSHHSSQQPQEQQRENIQTTSAQSVYSYNSSQQNPQQQQQQQQDRNQYNRNYNRNYSPHPQQQQSDWRYHDMNYNRNYVPRYSYQQQQLQQQHNWRHHDRTYYNTVYSYRNSQQQQRNWRNSDNTPRTSHQPEFRCHKNSNFRRQPTLPSILSSVNDQNSISNQAIEVRQRKEIVESSVIDRNLISGHSIQLEIRKDMVKSSVNKVSDREEDKLKKRQEMVEYQQRICREIKQRKQEREIQEKNEKTEKMRKEKQAEEYEQRRNEKEAKRLKDLEEKELIRKQKIKENSNKLIHNWSDKFSKHLSNSTVSSKNVPSALISLNQIPSLPREVKSNSDKINSTTKSGNSKNEKNQAADPEETITPSICQPYKLIQKKAKNISKHVPFTFDTFDVIEKADLKKVVQSSQSQPQPQPKPTTNNASFENLVQSSQLPSQPTTKITQIEIETTNNNMIELVEPEKVLLNSAHSNPSEPTTKIAQIAIEIDTINYNAIEFVEQETILLHNSLREEDMIIDFTETMVTLQTSPIQPLISKSDDSSSALRKSPMKRKLISIISQESPSDLDSDSSSVPNEKNDFESIGENQIYEVITVNSDDETSLAPILPPHKAEFGPNESIVDIDKEIIECLIEKLIKLVENIEHDTLIQSLPIVVAETEPNPQFVDSSSTIFKENDSVVPNEIEVPNDDPNDEFIIEPETLQKVEDLSHSESENQQLNVNLPSFRNVLFKGINFLLLQFGPDHMDNNINLRNSLVYLILCAGGLITRIIKIEEKNNALNLIRVHEGEFKTTDSEKSRDTEIPILVRNYSVDDFAYLDLFQKEMMKDLYASTFIYSCLTQNNLDQLSKYIIGESLFNEYDAQELVLLNLNEKKGWNSMTLKEKDPIITTVKPTRTLKTKGAQKYFSPPKPIKPTVKRKKQPKEIKDSVKAKLFVCKCGKEFAKISTIRAHKMRCDKCTERKKICPVPGCNASFFLTNDLKDHGSIHSDVRLPCPHCTATFTSKKTLCKHLREKVCTKEKRVPPP